MEEICSSLICTIQHLEHKHQQKTNELKILTKTNEILTEHMEKLQEITSDS